MRQVELVVRYVDGPVKSIPGQGYAGVFKSDPELDEVFRASEPPTHDDWQPAGLDEWAHRRFVGTALRRINEYLGEMVGTSARPEAASTSGSLPLGLVADELGGLLRGIGGSGAGRAGPLAVPTREGIELGGERTERGSAGVAGTRTNGGERARVLRPSIRNVGAPALVHLEDGSAEVRAEFVLETAGRPVKLLGTAEVLTMDGSQVERTPPRGADQPRITRWIAPSGRQSFATSADAGDDESGTWVVAASHDPDLMIRIGIDLEAAET
jgi:hypothetical protein